MFQCLCINHKIVLFCYFRTRWVGCILYVVMRPWGLLSRHPSTWEQIGMKSSGAKPESIGVCAGTTLCLLEVTGCGEDIKADVSLRQLFAGTLEARGLWVTLPRVLCSLLCFCLCFSVLLSWSQLTCKRVALLDILQFWLPSSTKLFSLNKIWVHLIPPWCRLLQKLER